MRHRSALMTVDLDVGLGTTWTDVLQTRAALEKSDQTAFTWLGADADHDTSITYAELDCRARAIGGLLQDSGPAGERARPGEVFPSPHVGGPAALCPPRRLKGAR